MVKIHDILEEIMFLKPDTIYNEYGEQKSFENFNYNCKINKNKFKTDVKKVFPTLIFIFKS